MPEESAPESLTRVSILDFWSDGKVWFRESIAGDRPWGDESLLPPVPEEAAGQWGLKVGQYVEVDGQRYEPGNFVVVADRQELRKLASGIEKVEGLVFPWFDRVVPPSLWLPHLHKIDQADYRRTIGSAWIRALVVSAGLVAAAFAFPQFMMLALLGAVFYGLFPLVDNTMAWLRRVELLSVEDLNRQLVNHELFRLWLLKRPTLSLKLAVGVLVLVYLGQMWVDFGSPPRALAPSIQAAALVKNEVLQGGEWWRLVTTGLMHGSILHILFNGIALFSLGRVLSALVSPPVLGVVFLLTVVTGSLASLYLGQAPASVGASGGLLGCLGFLLVATQKFREQLPDFLRASLIQSTIVVAIFGLLGARFIDNAAHAGGFLGGVLIGLVAYGSLSLSPGRISPFVRLAGRLSIAVLLCGVAKIAIELAALGAARG